MSLAEAKTKSTAWRASTYRRWRAAVKRAGLFHPGDRVGVAVSGGPDSMLLLDFMKEYSPEAGLTLAVLHFNHRLRGAESDEDERFVRTGAERLGIDFLCSGAPVKELARERKMNIESVARELRYRFFGSFLREGKLNKVATAHTANDQAETVLLRLLRGTGTRGLGGIRLVVQVPGGQVVRPFLGLTRPEVEAEVARRAIVFRTDASNLDASLARNRVRQQVLPLLSREFNPGVVRTLAAFADRALADEAFLDAQSRQCADELVVQASGALTINCRRLNELPSAIARRVLRQGLEQLRTLSTESQGAPRLWDSRPAVTHAEIESVSHLASIGQSGKRLRLGGDIMVRREFDLLIIEKPQNQAAFPETPHRHKFAYPLQLPADVAVSELGLRLKFRLADMGGTLAAKTEYTGWNGVWLDAGCVSARLILRNWRPGDRVGPAASARPLKLKELFQRRRIPSWQRPYWPVLEAANEIIWAKGFEAQFERRAPSRYRLLVSEEPYPSAGGG
ncbi:MAG TPA: tRNA lysidine(34) synthetase TilS [Terriglobia bacterium]|nr:tRNA lysidine(34) synthetase TilS [Terriglobia bacterium]